MAAVGAPVSEPRTNGFEYLAPQPAGALADRWCGASRDVIERCMEVLLVDGVVGLAAQAECRRHLLALDNWLQESAGKTAVTATTEELCGYLVEFIREGLALDWATSAVESMRRFYAFLQAMGFREDDPAAELDLSSGA